MTGDDRVDDDEERALQAALAASRDASKTEDDVTHKTASVRQIELSTGSTIGRYVVLQLLGKGGMGSVYAAWDPDLGRRVALKILHVVGPRAAQERARMLREARAIAQLDHENVVRVFDVGSVALGGGEGDAGVPYIAMELIEGATLRERLPRAGAREIVEMFLAAGRGLAAVHALGLVHRDFKPANVLVGRDGRVCISDFGLAVAGSDAHASPAHDSPTPTPTPTPSTLDLDDIVTAPGAVAGTPAYMAPEQFRAEAVDGRADQFSFALSLWTALYGGDPFAPNKRSAEDRHRALADAPVRRRSTLRTRIYEGPLRRALSFDREQRYPEMNALLRALQNARARPLRLLAAGVVVVVAAIVAWFALAHAGEADPCGVHARARAAFSSDARAALERSLASAGLTSSTSLTDASKHLDAYVGRWTSTAETACFFVDASEKDAVNDCLSRRLDEVSALAAALSQSTPAALADALPAVLALRPPASCLAEKGQKVTAAAAHDLEQRLAVATAASLAGRPADARTLAHAVGADAEREHADRIAGEAAHVEGVAAGDVGAMAESEALLRTAVARAMASGDARAEADAWADLLLTVGDRAHRPIEAEGMIPFAEASLARVPEDVEFIAKVRYAESLVAALEGRLADAERLAADACALAD
ncbi:MAG TPA: serine/threonine-protein kinase, partial [Myxococcota bacterium]